MPNHLSTNYNDIIGKQFGDLTVVEFAGFKYPTENSRVRKSYYKCKCACGNEKEISRNDLLTGRTNSCGCKQFQLKEDLTGQRFGRLTVLGRDFSKGQDKKHKVVYYKCICDCGNITISPANSLKGGKSRSCGCLQKEKVGSVNGHTYRNGLSTTPLYIKWKGMRQRCYNPKDKEYSGYGGRGIKICDRWLDFENFYNDMIDSYNQELEKYNGDKSKVTIDRKDVNGDYSPDNCRWLTLQEQNRNRRTTKFVEVYGKRMALIDAYELYSPQNLTYSIVKSRIDKGENVYDALLTPREDINTDNLNGVIKPLIFLPPDQDLSQFA